MTDPFDPTGVFAAATPSVIEVVPRLAHTKGFTRKGAPIPTKPKGTLNKTTRKALKLIVEHNLDPREAYTLVNGKEPTQCALEGIRSKISDYSLKTDEMQRLAGSVVKNALKGKPLKTSKLIIDKATGRPVMREDDPTQPLEYIEKVYPSHTNMLAAASMVQDRVDPIVRQNINLNGNLADFLPFELDKYR